MNREIKVKFWYKEEEKMFGPYEFKEECFSILTNIDGNESPRMTYFGERGAGVNLWSLDDYVDLWYTGLKDKTGQEIYEGDILSSTDRSQSFEADILNPYPNHQPVNGVVKFRGGAFWFNRTNGTVKLLTKLNDNWVEIIGNKFEDEELLQEVEQ